MWLSSVYVYSRDAWWWREARTTASGVLGTYMYTSPKSVAARVLSVLYRPSFSSISLAVESHSSAASVAFEPAALGSQIRAIGLK